MDRINQVWPKWHTVELIGRGGFGDVYKAKRQEMGETFYSAVKVIQIPREQQEVQELKNEGHTSQSIQAYYESVARDLMNEIKMMETLKSAANVVNIEEFEIRERSEGIGWEAFIRMELLQNLNEFRAGRILPPREVVKLGLDICQALICCEQKQIIHRDIKPCNIFVDAYGQFKLGDFGIARQLEKTQSTLSQKGTEAYMAPEVRRGERGGYNVDLYSLGLVLYRLLNKNKMPFEPLGKELCTYQEREEALERRMRGERLPLPVGADRALGEIVCKACACHKADRYQSASEMRKALEAWERNQDKASEEDFREKKQKKSDDFQGQGKAGADQYQTREIRLGQKSFTLTLEDGKKLRVNVPANARNGMKIRLQGKGKPGENGGKPGDLYVTLHISADEELDETVRVRRAPKKEGEQEKESGFAGEKAATAFGPDPKKEGERAEAGKPQQGKDIRLTQRIKPGQKEFTLTLAGGKKLLVQVPEGTAAGSVIRLAGRGEPGKNGGKAGDLLVTLVIEGNRRTAGKGSQETRTVTRLAARGPLMVLMLLFVLADEWRIWQLSTEGAKAGVSLGQWLVEHRSWTDLAFLLVAFLLIYFGHRYIAGGICMMGLLIVGTDLNGPLLKALGLEDGGAWHTVASVVYVLVLIVIALMILGLVGREKPAKAK